MTFDVLHPLKKASDVFIANVVAYFIGVIIAVLGSLCLITIAPFGYGLYYMAVKGTHGEKVEIKDVFHGFSSGMFVRSWVGLIGFSLIFFIVIFLGLISRFLEMSILFSFLSLIICFILLIFLFFTLYIYVMSPSEDILYALKESIRISKSNIIATILTMLVNAVFLALFVTAPIGLLFAVYVLKEIEPSIKDRS